MSRQDDYEIRHAGAERALKEVARALKETMPPGFGFTLFVFSYGSTPDDPGSMFYLSSATRPDMLQALKEFIRKQESGT